MGEPTYIAQGGPDNSVYRGPPLNRGRGPWSNGPETDELAAAIRPLTTKCGSGWKSRPHL